MYRYISRVDRIQSQVFDVSRYYLHILLPGNDRYRPATGQRIDNRYSIFSPVSVIVTDLQLEVDGGMQERNGDNDDQATH